MDSRTRRVLRRTDTGQQVKPRVLPCGAWTPFPRHRPQTRVVLGVGVRRGHLAIWQGSLSVAFPTVSPVAVSSLGIRPNCLKLFVEVKSASIQLNDFNNLNAPKSRAYMPSTIQLSRLPECPQGKAFLTWPCLWLLTPMGQA